MVARRSGTGASARRGTLLRRRAERRRKLIAVLVGAGIVVVPVVGWRIFRTPAPRPPLSMEQARAANAAIPFVAGPIARAPRFVFRGTPAARLQATECLATVAIYEAGGDSRGQKAVMQVVLNRVRAPGFPKTICGVVYQGAALKTGCQFSFACDGSVQRRPERAGWIAARKIAGKGLVPLTQRSAPLLIITPTGSCPTGSARSTRSPRSKPTSSIGRISISRRIERRTNSMSAALQQNHSTDVDASI
jgi:hypothetical protein